MLYKKIHRQYLRQFRIGRWFKYKYSRTVYEVTSEPHISQGCIWLEGYILIEFTGPYKGALSVNRINAI